MMYLATGPLVHQTSLERLQQCPDTGISAISILRVCWFLNSHFHRLNLLDELDNDALSDGGEEPMTQEEEGVLIVYLQSD